MYVYRWTETELWAVGVYDGCGKWTTTQECLTKEEAITRVVLLNGDRGPAAVTQEKLRRAELRIKEAVETERCLLEQLQRAIADRDVTAQALVKERAVADHLRSVASQLSQCEAESETNVCLLQQVTAHRDRLSETNYDLQRKLELTNRLSDVSDASGDAELARAAACEQALIVKNRELADDNIHLRASLQAIAALATHEAKGVSREN